MPRYQRILIPTDFSEGVTEALSHAAELARQYKAGITLLHVVDSRYYPSGFFPSYEYFQRLLTELKAHAKAQMENLSRSPRFRGIALTAKLREGDPALEIVGAAREEKADLIVMGTHGRTGLGHLLIGSTAEKVVRTSPCPVLTVRSKAAPAAGQKPRRKRLGRKRARP
jgi:nucleotide-binding universal stress UspA family protein